LNKVETTQITFGLFVFIKCVNVLNAFWRATEMLTENEAKDKLLAEHSVSLTVGV